MYRAKSTTRRSTLNDRHAFTMVELLIVVLLMGIAAAVAVPLLTQTNATRLQAAARLLIADLGFAQVESITHAGDTCVVTFDTATATYTIARKSAPATPITNPGDNRPYTTTFGAGRAAEMAGVTIQGYSLDSDNVLGFGILGETDQATAATITLQAGTSTLTIQVDPTTGEASLQ